MQVAYSVVIPAYNEEEFLPKTIQALRQAMDSLHPLPGELVVVDNNSADGTASVAASLGARVVFEPVNQIARARNCGATAAQGAFLVFVDADTLVSPELLHQALAALTSGDVCGGGALIGTSEAKTPGMHIALGSWNTISRLFGYAAGSFVYCLHEAWQDVGGFDEQLYASEEIAFSKALRSWGRSHGNLRFRVLSERVDTSTRKMAWFGRWGLFKRGLPLLLMPGRLRSREHCSLWYTRPPKARSNNPEPADAGEKISPTRNPRDPSERKSDNGASQ